MSRHIFAPRATDRNGVSISGVVYEPYPYAVDADWYSRVDGEWIIDELLEPAALSFYASDDTTSPSTVDSLVTGTDGFPLIAAYLPTGIYTMVGRVQTPTGERVFIDPKYEAGIFEQPPFEGVVGFAYPDAWDYRPHGLLIQKTGERWQALIADLVSRYFPVSVFDASDASEEVWVSPTGSDGNDGSKASPYATILKAFSDSKARVMVMPGDYINGWTASADPLVPCAVIAPFGRARFIRGVSTTARTWVDQGGGVYLTDPAADFSVAYGHVFDQTQLDKRGLFTRLVRVDTAVECQALAGSWCALDEDTMYIHLHDGREPDVDVLLCNYATNPEQSNQHSIYLKNISFIGGRFAAYDFRPETLDVLMYAEDCEFMGSHLNGGLRVQGGFTIMNRCLAALNGADQFNYHEFNSNPSLAIEIDCIAHVPDWAGDQQDAPTNNNASTAHQGCQIIRVGGNYSGQKGPTVVDVNDSESLNVGIQSVNTSTAAAYYQNGTGTSYLIDSRIEGDSVAITQVDNASMYKDQYTKIKGSVGGTVLDL